VIQFASVILFHQQHESRAGRSGKENVELLMNGLIVSQFENACPQLQDGCSTLDQAVVADFINEGYFARHLKKMQRLYSERRLAVADSMQRSFGDRLKFSLPTCGLQLTARMADDDSDVAFAVAAQRSGFAVEPLSQRSVKAPVRQGLLMGFANVSSTKAASLASALKASAVD
jgi:GntR family transcriptional regulator/MocR family aminotransferase